MTDIYRYARKRREVHSYPDPSAPSDIVPPPEGEQHSLGAMLVPVAVVAALLILVAVLLRSAPRAADNKPPPPGTVTSPIH